ncbi:DUF3180 domain-containing protein [Bifidobacterium gallicum]|uniref:Membrane protein n=1 Tax=Bifidobacterium gallicum DSM 20093 = LMG 11596 TaxID=561180 RepID=D1NV08_9BIFI|nr:DUF3180 domain-containing protein [Bifidobacterium gallicum]EFA22659.1 hypothetical protein BIFGAL_03686 [Bifidobacterium gallicum DSM 20093 = LMG 11596]KFI59622.1 membrane protein [Bifidobacterium gallicum DSM 20093 = LMG 11596]
MRAHRIAWWVYVLTVAIGLVGGILVKIIDEKFALGVLGAPWFISAIMVLLGFVVVALAWQVQRYAKADARKRVELKTITPERAVNTLILAKALALAGSILLGWYCGQLIMCIGHAEAAYYKTAMIQCGLAAGASFIDMILGIISERFCQLPPNEGPEHPKMRQRARASQTRLQAGQGKPCSA